MALVATIIPLARDAAERSRQTGLVRKACYVGFVRNFEREVWACSPKGLTQLRPRKDLLYLSPLAFDWGTTDVGALHLSLAILSHWAGSDDFAKRHYRDFTDDVLRNLTDSSWELTTAAIAHSIRSYRAEPAAKSCEGVDV